jgi:hypothetical protein
MTPLIPIATPTTDRFTFPLSLPLAMPTTGTMQEWTNRLKKKKVTTRTQEWMMPETSGPQE